MNFSAVIITTDPALLSIFPSSAEQNSNERRIALTVNALLSSQLRLRHVSDQFRDLCAWRPARLVIDGNPVEPQVLPIARALRTARHKMLSMEESHGREPNP